MLHENSLLRDLFQVFLIWQLIILVKRSLWQCQQVAVLSVWKYTEILLEEITFYTKNHSIRGDVRENNN